jgi:hypothetical protein
MSIYTGLPVLNVPFLRPESMSFDTPGGGISGGKNIFEQSVSIGLTGGPVVIGSYQQCYIHGDEQFEYVNWLGARLNGSHRFINVPIITDYSGPFPTNAQGVKTSMISGIPHSDGSFFSDSSGYSQATVNATIQPAALNAGIVTVNVTGASRDIRFSEWFSVYHPNKGWRAYRNWEIISKTGTTTRTYVLAISPSLREAVTSVQEARFSRPLCAMKFPQGFTLPFAAKKYWEDMADLRFEEAY